MKIRLNKKNAFTLIEMILAIGISALVLVAINAVFFTALHLRNAAADAVDGAAPLDQAVSIIRRDLQCAVTPKANGIMSGDFKVGNVTSTGINEPVAAEIYTATGALSENQPWGDIQRVTYELKNSGDSSGTGKDLYRSVTRNLLAITAPDVEDQLMISGVASVKFSCYDGSQWLDAWDTTSSSSNTNLPVAVRVEIQPANGGPDAPPVEILVPIDSQSRTNSTSTVGSS